MSDMINRDTAVLGARMSGLEVEVRTLGQKFVDHEAADERRHRETIDALHELRETVRQLDTSAGEGAKGAKVPLMQRDGVSGMTLRETINMVLLIVGVIGALAAELRGESVQTEQVAKLIQQVDHAEKAPAQP